MSCKMHAKRIPPTLGRRLQENYPLRITLQRIKDGNNYTLADPSHTVQ